MSRIIPTLLASGIESYVKYSRTWMRVWGVRQEWDVPTWQNMEYDEFDNPATTYFVWRDEDRAVRGCARLYPTDHPYMLKKAFSFLVTGVLPDNDMTIWEGSRLCVDKELPAPLRRRIIYDLSVAYMEYALSNGIQKIIGVMLPVYWRSVYMASGRDPSGTPMSRSC